MITQRAIGKGAYDSIPWKIPIELDLKILVSIRID